MEGRIGSKETAGTITGDKTLESAGKADRRAGEVKQRLEHAKGKIEEFIDKAEDRGNEAIDKIKGAANSKLVQAPAKQRRGLARFIRMGSAALVLVDTKSTNRRLHDRTLSSDTAQR